MPKADGQCTEGRKEPAGSPGWEGDACAEEQHNSNTGQKDDFSILQNISGY